MKIDQGSFGHHVQPGVTIILKYIMSEKLVATGTVEPVCVDIIIITKYRALVLKMYFD